MEDINFASLAPRHGSRPYMGTWNEIGTSQLNGGAFSWSSLWSGIKNFGSSIKSFGNKAWNSNTGQMLRDKLKDQNFQQKVVDGLASGINGVVDIANQALQNQINQRLENSRQPPVALKQRPTPEPEEVEVEEKLPPLETAPPLPSKGEKRPRPELEETLVVESREPPSYEQALKEGASYPMTRPIGSMARPVYGKEKTPVTLELPPPAPTVPPMPAPTLGTNVPRLAAPTVAVATPARRVRGANWQSTLNSIVGLGVKSLKRRRCY